MLHPIRPAFMDCWYAPCAFIRRTLCGGDRGSPWSVIVLAIGLGVAPALAAEVWEYNRDIRPILAENCFACHGADSAAREADLRLDQREAAMDQGAIVPGEPDESEMIARIFADDAELLMPPPETKKHLTPDERERIRRWIADGAVYQPHWSFLPPARPPLPPVQNPEWVSQPVDHFVLARLEQLGLAPAPAADAATLFRRLHLDVTGLPPEPGEVEQFEEDYRIEPSRAVEVWVDRLMDRPAWGEHRARYWLDAARYGDTHGMHFDNYREMWPYRDGVIRAFNANQPFDRFTVEQLAGDLLPNATDEQKIATGFQRCNITTNEGGTIEEENLALYAADRVQTLGWVYLGLTTNCAQCHDHKFDPLTMADYYGLAAFFRNTTQTGFDGNVKDGRGPAMVVPSDEDRGRWQALPGEIGSATSRRDMHRAEARDTFVQWLESTQAAVGSQPEAIEDGLLLHLPLNEGAGNEALNLTGTPERFRASGDVTWDLHGLLGPAPVVQLGHTFELGHWGDFALDQAFSCSAWIRSGREGVYGGIIARMDEQQNYRGWDLFQNSRSLAVHLIDRWPNNALKVITRNSVLRPGEWQHVCLSYDGSGAPEGVRIYVDGLEEELQVATHTLGSDASIRTETPLRIGQRSHTQLFDGGAIQDLRLYDRALLPGEVLRLADKQRIRETQRAVTRQLSPDQVEAWYEHYLKVHDAAFIQLDGDVARLEAERQAIRDRSPVTHIQEERSDRPPMARILLRGEYDKPGEEVSAHTPAFLHPWPETAPQNRLGLAHWLVDPANPLLARVTVNRFWQEVFGRGLVATPEDFGVTGVPPSHPELLDWLAVEFRESGWDVKQLFRLLFTSATYRQSAAMTEAKLEQDPDNVWLSRGPRFRLDAEMIRDQALAASGLLSPKMFGPSVKPYQPPGIWDVVGLPEGNTRKYEPDRGADLYRRSVYTFWKRMAPPPNLELFNAPSREVCTVRRERTNTPLQALVTLNDPVFMEAARNLAQQAMAASGDEPPRTDRTIVDRMARRVLGRALRDAEAARLLEDHRRFLAYYQEHPTDAQALTSVGESAVPASTERTLLAAWTMVGNQLLNLDEALNK